MRCSLFIFLCLGLTQIKAQDTTGADSLKVWIEDIHSISQVHLARKSLEGMEMTWECIDTLPQAMNCLANSYILRQDSDHVCLFKAETSEVHDFVRFQYLYLSANELSVFKAKSRRELLQDSLKLGVDFSELVVRNTMDGKPLGIMEWCPKYQIVDCFYEFFESAAVGEVWAIDCPDKGWYYLARLLNAPEPKRRMEGPMICKETQ